VYDEKQVLRRIQQGDRCAFEELLDHYETRVYRLTLRYANCVQDAEISPGNISGVYPKHRHFQGSLLSLHLGLSGCSKSLLEYRRRKRPDSVPYEEDLGLAVTNWRDDPVRATNMAELTTEIETALTKLTRSIGM